MAHTVEITKILDGPRNVVLHVFIQGDGVSSDLSDEVLVDPAQDLIPVGNNIPSLTIEKLWYDLTGFNGILNFEYLVSNTPVWSMSGEQSVHMDFSHFGGLKDRSNVLDGSGKLLLSTTGLGSAEDVGTIIIKLRKD